jgi:hypothetical protein
MGRLNVPWEVGGGVVVCDLFKNSWFKLAWLVGHVLQISVDL